MCSVPLSFSLTPYSRFLFVFSLRCPSLSVAPVSWGYFKLQLQFLLMVFAVLGSEGRGAVQQWLPQYPLILTSGSCLDTSVVQRILRNSTTVATVSSSLHLVLAYFPSESFLFAIHFSCPDTNCYQVASWRFEMSGGVLGILLLWLLFLSISFAI